MAVSNHDDLEFLVDIVPTTVTYKQYKEKKANTNTGSRKSNGVAKVTEVGQTTLEKSKSTQNGHIASDEMSEDGEDMDADNSAQLHVQSNIRQTRTSLGTSTTHDSPEESADDVKMP